MKTHNLYSKASKYYDFLEDKNQIKQEINFLGNTLKKFDVKNVLDLACGTGIYLVSLKKKKFNVEGLDLSKDMLKEVKKKDKSIRLYNQDMSSFRIDKKYDAIICLSSSFAALKNLRLMKKTIKNIFNHLNEGGICILDLPNHDKEIKEVNNIKKQISGKIPEGYAKFTFFHTKKGKKWKQIWDGEIIQKGKKKIVFQELWDEFIYPPKKLEKYITKINFQILEMYGSINGEKFNINKSYHKTYLLKKKNKK